MAITNVVGRGGKVMDSSFRATIIGGPALAAKLRKLDLVTSGQAAKDAVMAMGHVMAVAWSERVPIGSLETGDQMPGAYRDELRLPGVVKAGINKGMDPEGIGVLKGASGSVGPRKRPALSGLPDNQQPAVYAARLEFGDLTHPAEPSGRPAFDASREAAVAAAEIPLRRAVLAIR